jgi:hypothetical protein
VVFGNASGFDAAFELDDLDGNNGFRLDGQAASHYSGYSVSAAGDINGDGSDDVIVGAYGASPNGSRSGAAYVVFGKTTGFAAEIDLASLDGTNGFKLNGEANTAGDTKGGFAGFAVSGAGDFNGDGFADLLIGAPYADTTAGDDNAGAAYIVFGTAAAFGATFELASLDGNNGIRLTGEEAYGLGGWAVSAAGDLNGDGFDDVTLTRRIVSGGETGGAYVVFGAMPGEAVTRVGTAIGNTINGGNLDDLVKGLGGQDTLIGHDGNDRLVGGRGHDILIGGEGRDWLQGGAGADAFVFATASDSTGREFDTLENANFDVDLFDVGSAVTGIDATIGEGTLRGRFFDADLAAAVDESHLAANHAVLFTPDAGGQGGHAFLVVDLNGAAGYQSGDDLVLRFVDPANIESLAIGNFI